MDNLLTGWQRVRDNHGCAGADGVSIEEFEHALKDNLALLAAEISRRTYCPLPLLKILVDKGKGDGESRVLSIPTVRDRVAQVGRGPRRAPRALGARGGGRLLAPAVVAPNDGFFKIPLFV